MASPFETLGLTPRYALNAGELEQRQRELNRALHPDRHSKSGGAERRRALSRSMDINQAYRMLRDPVTRGEAMLAELGAAPGSTSTVATPPALLMEMMEQREALAEAAQRNDIQAIAALRESLSKRQQTLQARLAAAFGEAKEIQESGAAPDLGAALELLGELRYIRRFADEVAAAEDEL